MASMVLPSDELAACIRVSFCNDAWNFHLFIRVAVNQVGIVCIFRFITVIDPHLKYIYFFWFFPYGPVFRIQAIVKGLPFLNVVIDPTVRVSGKNGIGKTIVLYPGDLFPLDLFQACIFGICSFCQMSDPLRSRWDDHVNLTNP